MISDVPSATQDAVGLQSRATKWARVGHVMCVKSEKCGSEDALDSTVGASVDVEGSRIWRKRFPLTGR